MIYLWPWRSKVVSVSLLVSLSANYTGSFKSDEKKLQYPLASSIYRGSYFEIHNMKEHGYIIIEFYYWRNHYLSYTNIMSIHKGKC